MLDLLLDAQRFTILVAVLAVLTPACGWLLRRRFPATGRRLPLVVALFGPFALGLWGLHNAVLTVLGFDSIFSAIVMVVIAAAVGWLAGDWVRRDPEALN